MKNFEGKASSGVRANRHLCLKSAMKMCNSNDLYTNMAHMHSCYLTGTLFSSNVCKDMCL